MHWSLEVLSRIGVFQLVLSDKWKTQALGVYSDIVPSILWTLNCIPSTGFHGFIQNNSLGEGSVAKDESVV